MNGIGRSLREESQRPLYLHCCDVVVDLCRVMACDGRRCINALAELAKLPLLILFLLLCPITVPLAAYYRKRYAVRAVEKWERERERVMK